jgi:N-acetylmuramoyl-L-alanine amidase
MSHISRIKTQMVEAEYLTQALTDLGYTWERGPAQVKGFGGQRATVDIKVSSGHGGHDIGFHKTANGYELVADWWDVRGIRQKDFLQHVAQRYAYHATRAKLEEQGFELVSEETEPGERIRLVLRRIG